MLDNKSRARLQFLDLIAQAKVPPSEATVAAVGKDKVAMLSKLHAALEAECWDAVNNASYNLQRLVRHLEPTVQDVLTEKGKSLLQNGEVNVKVRKVGCV